MRGECGIFVKDGKPIGGFFAWKIEMNPVRTGMDGNSPVYKVGHCRLTLKNWWIDLPTTTVKAVLCRAVPCSPRYEQDEKRKPNRGLKRHLIPVQEVEMTPGEYAPGIRNAELIIEKACPRVGGEPV